MLKTILSNWLIPAIAITFLLLAVSFFVPGWARVITGIIFSFILGIAILPAVGRQRKLYRENRISRAVLARNVLYEVMGILLAMALAFLLGRYVLEIATEQISNVLIKFVAGVAISLLAGMGAGFLVKRAWSRLGIS